ncbi:MAG: Gfo/Idh/MocA family oxidoreductase, partial [Caldilineaceae bacterium]|nr:Gfo/Idh/MocA family oxidoreductase [Caldilineaceae bacterium]MCB0138978.1 Gfo/Idh/MocA family oxidoreductase [Caldilineaceae bacterium]
SQAELTAAADINSELLEKVQADFGCPQVFDYYEEMLDEVALDAVYIFGDNATGSELAIRAAERGLHILLEKPMSSNLNGAVRMLSAARKAGVELMVNWPFAWWPQLQKAMQMAQSGELGQLFSVKYRSAHAGPKELGCTPYFYDWLYDGELNGAGALMDYCCYGTALARYLLGMPSRVTGVVGQLQKEYTTVDDNAVIVMQSPSSIAISEASWTQIGHLTSYTAMIYGSEGTLVVEPGANGRLLLANREYEDGTEVDVPALPPEMQSATAHFLDCIINKKPVTGLCSPRIGRDAQEILEAGLLSAEQGAAVSLPLPIDYL